MEDLRTPRPNIGEQKSPKLPLDLAVIITQIMIYM